MAESVDFLVEGGAATAGPPIGPSLAPMGVNAALVVKEINEKTADFKGMKVPVKVTVDPTTKKFEITIGMPPTTALIKKELGIEKGTKDKTPVGDISMERLVEIAKKKRDSMLASNLKNAVKEAIGACQSLGVNIEGKRPREAIKEINEGRYDSVIGS
ncbi:MAG: 50S ribosomal protein L11 [Candidatus Altiarchaeales archaeon]|nr:50S ribosomal protein L11 [Candidatus Altiarchaeales archaeon]